MNIDFLIVGQGIAGSVLSYSLLKAGFRVLVIGKQALTVSSEVAAGLYNPVTGRKMVKTWNADALFSSIEPVYRDMERISGARFLNAVPIYRPFVDTAEQNDWFGRQMEAAYAPYLQGVFEKPQKVPVVLNPYGGVLLRQSGWLDIPVMLRAWKKHLAEEGAFLDEVFNEDLLEEKGGELRYRNVKAKKIIYCNGNGVLGSRFWNWVPMRPVKGEVLKLKSTVELDWVINRGVFLLHTGGGEYKLGSTYDQLNLNLEPTEAAKEEMIQKLKNLVQIPFDILGQKAGLRPATKDRRPVVGSHPDHKLFLIFNGLGTKGVSLAPYYSELLANSLLNNKELPADININRFFSLY